MEPKMDEKKLKEMRQQMIGCGNWKEVKRINKMLEFV
jgi:hypothetical protein